MISRTDTGYVVYDTETILYLLLSRYPTSHSIDWVGSIIDATVFNSIRELDMWVRLNESPECMITMVKQTRSVEVFR